MITIIPAGKGGSTPTPTPVQQLKIVSNDDSIKVFENDEDETERNIERFNYLAAEDIDNGAACYFNFIEEDNAGAGAKNLVEYVINTKEGRKINFSMICPYSPTSLDDFTIKITGDVLEDDGFYIELYSDPGDGDGNRYQGYFGVIWFYSASFNASGGNPDQQFFVQVAGDKTNVNWQWLGLSPEAYERLVLLQDEGYYMRDFWEVPKFNGFDFNFTPRILGDSCNILSISSVFPESDINVDDLQCYNFGTIFLSSKVELNSIHINNINSVIADFSDLINNTLSGVNTIRKYDFNIVRGTFFLTKDQDKKIDNIILTKSASTETNFKLNIIVGAISFTADLENVAVNDDMFIPIIENSYIGFGKELHINNGNEYYSDTQNQCKFIKNVILPKTVNLYTYPLFHGWIKLETIDLSNINFIGSSLLQAFAWCSSLTKIDMSNCDFSNIKTLHSFAQDCSALIEIDFSGCDLSYFFANPVTANYMFKNCNNLTTIKAIGCNADTIAFLESVKPAGATVVTV